MANKDGFSTTLDDLDQGFGQTSRMTAAFEAELDRLRQSMTVTARGGIAEFRDRGRIAARIRRAGL
jgi:hypothetical protein